MHKSFQEKVVEQIHKTRKLLNGSEENLAGVVKPEWKTLYAIYTEKLPAEKFENFKKARGKFHIKEPFSLYINLGTLMNRKNKFTFSFRYVGQEVAKIQCGIFDSCTLSTEVKVGKRAGKAEYMYENNVRDFSCNKDNEKIACADSILNKPLNKADWTGVEAREFCNYFTEHEPRRLARKSGNAKNNEEHRIEFLLYKEFSKNNKKNKEVCYIQPLKKCNTYISFPTMVSASKKVKIGRGNIDILARTKDVKHNKSYLTVIEVKTDKSQPPEEAKLQGIAYAVFMRELLRSAYGDFWYKFFGINSPLPENLIIRVACAMPGRKDSDSESKPVRINIPNTSDYLEIHSIFFEDNKEKGVLENFDHTFDDEIIEI